MKKNIFLTAPPRSGKTTIIKKIIGQCSFPCKGFFTSEILENGRRQGFMMHTLDEKKALLGHRKIKSKFFVSKYGVSIENIEQLAVPAIKPDDNRQIIILDEIGKMECFSDKFKDAALNALRSPNHVIGTIAVGGTEFIKKIKQRNDMELIEITRENRDTVPLTIIKAMQDEYK